MVENNIWAIIPAAGIGSRMGSDIPKQYLEIGSKTILEHSASNFLKHSQIYKVIIVLHPQDNRWHKLSVAKDPKIVTVIGGEERADSVLAGLEYIQQNGGADDWVMVHDAARPCLYTLHIDNLLQAKATSPDGVILAVPSYDTVKFVDKTQTIDRTIKREAIWLAQTPQFFPCEKLQKSINHALADNFEVTDESSAMESQGYRPALVTGSRRNIKVTEQEDLLLASVILAS
ncbi:2-C-methyl-D-erythritol 4-phosphate cytidylyltransferase [Kangiella sp. HZ709]|uniref:2-C-methyl-D-erythritol 4-phosphate cytidylyltransferase n=1 Tax=Kangiella sp. HZ709 TaxID=2666328 RepID=UPI0012B0A995|nr:2-C-methyl-D-erythritol 4-phosphate cytidylyltransferase [Kangiella sp. HZ709]MRX28387.1 2-C-methyl-D-erythritol 4-phosphate cytidylyltransferase [Kangiella sp. HZ709]